MTCILEIFFCVYTCISKSEHCMHCFGNCRGFLLHLINNGNFPTVLDSSTNYLDWLTDLLSVIITGFILHIVYHEPFKLCWIFRPYKHYCSTWHCIFVRSCEYLCRVNSYMRHWMSSKLFVHFFSFFLSSFSSTCVRMYTCVCIGLLFFSWLQIDCLFFNQ